MTSSDSTRAFAIDRAATIAAIKRFEAATGRVLHAVEGFSDLPERELLQGLIKAAPKTKVVCVLSGGNVNLEQLRGLKWN